MVGDDGESAVDRLDRVLREDAKTYTESDPVSMIENLRQSLVNEGHKVERVLYDVSGKTCHVVLGDPSC